MLPDLSELRVRRLQAGLSQKRLASAAGISQSLVAKIERGSANPSYATVRRLFGALETVRPVSSFAADDVCQLRIFSVAPSDSIARAVRVLEDHGISQLPVMDHGVPVGSLSEKQLLLALGGSTRLADPKKTPVSRIMGDPFPTVSPKTPGRTVQVLLETVSAVLVVDRGKPKGIVTQSDLLARLLSAK